MADKFELNPEAVHASIASIVSAINGLSSINLKLDDNINTTTAFVEYKTKVDSVKALLTAEFPSQLQSALSGISAKVEALKDMDQKIKEMIQTQSSQSSGQGGSEGFR